MKRLLFLFAFAFLSAMPAAAQQLKLQISDGRVTLEAAGVPARAILAEWAKIGGTKVVGGDKVTGGPLTLKLVDVPERQALDIVLRNAAGFMAATRLPSAAPGASMYDRILILPTSTAAVASNAAGRNTSTNSSLAATQRGRVPPRPPNLPVNADDNPVVEQEQQVQEDTADTGVNQPVFTFPGPPGPNGQAPVFVPVPGNGMAGQPGNPPVITLTPNPNGQPTIYNFVPTPAPSSTSTPTFGVAGAPTPGMIQQPTPPVAPGTRPPPQ